MHPAESDPLAGALLAGAIAVGAAAELAATFAGRRGRSSGEAPRSLDRGTKYVVIAGTGLGVWSAWAIGKHGGPGAGSWALLGVGVVLILLGGALRAFAVMTLGRFFRREITVLEGQAIVRRGPYRVIRHPAYLGTLVWVLGFGLAVGGWLGAFAATALAFAGHVPRIRAEEAMLVDAFGTEYAEYSEATARLLPKVW